MPIPIQQKPPSEADTCAVSDPTCSAEQPSAQEQQPEQQPEQQTQEPQQQQSEPPDGTEVIRTTMIPIPNGTGKQQQYLEQQQAAPQAGPPSQQQQQFPDMRGLVRFLNNPEGAMATTDSTYLRTMYSTDSANLVLKSAMNSSGYY